MAASIAVAFGLGLWMYGGSWDAGHDSVAGGDGPTGSHALVQGGGPATSIAGHGAALPPGWRTVKVGLTGPSGREQVVVPVRQAEQLDWEWVRRQPSALSAADERALEQAGLRVTRERQLWPFDLEDGQQLILPVEQLDLHYVGDTR